MNSNEQHHEVGNRRFITTEDALPLFANIGLNKARDILANDPRAPRPIIDNGGRRLYSRKAIEAFLDRLEIEGLPADVDGEVRS